MTPQRKISRLGFVALFVVVGGCVFAVGISQWQSRYFQSQLDQANSQTVWDAEIERYREQIEKLERIPPERRTATDVLQLEQLTSLKSIREAQRADQLNGFRVDRAPGTIEIHVFAPEEMTPRQKAALLKQMRALRGDRDADITVRMPISASTSDLAKEISDACPACEFKH